LNWVVVSQMGLGFGVCLVAGLLLIATQRWHGALTADDHEGIQKFHVNQTPRVGGVPIVLALLVVAFFSGASYTGGILQMALWASLPAFAFGLAEDLTGRVSVAVRLAATMASGVLAWGLTGISLTDVDVWGLDYLLQFVFVSVFFTAFAIAGVANAVNIVDGMNGLASLTVMLCLAGLGAVAWQVNDHDLAFAVWTVAAVVLGFFVLNWPWGKLFLGDGGAYFLGFFIGWAAVLLTHRNPQVSPFAAVLLCIHPITEVLFSVYRRRVRHAHPGLPDRLHFHSLLKRRYVARFFSHCTLTQRNSITGILVGSMSLWGAFWACFLFDSVWASLLACLVYVLLYVLLYVRMTRHKWSFWS
jgi:UDP-N-acetylmuramyl pentapeptide phosphotransferase/UDP-N-acetylglucosamine-1-phosphate transferase